MLVKQPTLDLDELQLRIRTTADPRSLSVSQEPSSPPSVLGQWGSCPNMAAGGCSPPSAGACPQLALLVGNGTSSTHTT